MRFRKTLLRTVIIALALLPVGVFSHVGHGPGGHAMNKMGGQGVEGGTEKKMTPYYMTPQQREHIGEHILFMHEGRNRIAEETFPRARRTLVTEHLASMQSFMHGRVEDESQEHRKN